MKSDVIRQEQGDEIRPTDNVGNGKPKLGYCAYPPCGKAFVQTVSWKKHCSDDCRKLNWEARHGKKWQIKAAVADG